MLQPWKDFSLIFCHLSGLQAAESEKLIPVFAGLKQKNTEIPQKYRIKSLYGKLKFEIGVCKTFAADMV